MKIYLGIDAGGTSTDFSISDENGHILIEDKCETIHIKQVSKDIIEKRLFTTINKMIQKINSSIDNIECIFAGLPGFGEFPEVETLFTNLLKKLTGKNNFKLGNDCVSGWAGSQAAKPGVNMVLGTGSIAFGVDYKGNEERSSGWGPYCGDEGSGYWLGRETIFLFGKESDGRAEKGALYKLIKEEFNLVKDFDFIQKVLELNDDRTKIADFSKLLTKAANDGDKEAIKIIKKAAYESAIAIKAVIEKLNFEDNEKIYISYSGGVFNIGKLLTDEISELLSDDERIEIIDSILSPKRGSVLMALKNSGIDITNEIVENLKG